MKFYPDSIRKSLSLVFRKESLNRGRKKARNAPRKDYENLSEWEKRELFRIRQ